MVAPNTATAALTGTLTVAGSTITVTEAATQSIPLAPKNVRIKRKR
jgi:hypothetical protein